MGLAEFFVFFLKKTNLWKESHPFINFFKVKKSLNLEKYFFFT